MKASKVLDIAYHNEKICGIILRGSFCAEHESGISGIKKWLNNESAEQGIDRRRIIPNRSELLHFAKTKGANSENILYFSVISYPHDMGVYSIKTEISVVKQMTDMDFSGYGGAWSSESFCVRVLKKKQPELAQFIEDFHKAVTENDAAIWHANGLVLGIVSRLDPEILEAMRKSDAEADEKKLQKERDIRHRLFSMFRR